MTGFDLADILAGNITLVQFRSLIRRLGLANIGAPNLIAPEIPPELLPQRRHGKVSLPRLHAFFFRQGRTWFRLEDFRIWFDVHPQTAWEYLTALTGAGIFEHNGRASAAARYRFIGGGTR